MLAPIRQAAFSLQRQINRFFFPPIAPQLSLAGIPLTEYNNWMDTSNNNNSNDNNNSTTVLEDSLWFAVPKSKISRQKKRLKTTLQKRIKTKDNIVIDKRTGELTLKHKLPFNWKNYLPENAEHAPKP